MAAKVTNGSAVVVTGTGPGGKNNQVINGGNGADVINAASLFAADSTGTHTIVAGNGADVVNGSAFDEIIWGDSSGSSSTSDNGADTLRGGGGKDDIHGGNGADYISGDLGADNLWGDRGGDIFDYNFNADSSALLGAFNPLTGDWIRDFRGIDGDKLDFQSLDANGQITGAGHPDEVQWRGANNPGAYGLWYVQDIGAGFTYVYADTSGDGVADIAIKLSGIVALTPGNLLGVNQAPVANDDTNSVLEDSAISGSVAGNDSDPDGDTLSYSIGAAVAGLTFNADGSYDFDASDAAYQHLAAGATEEVVINYSSDDGHGGTDSATLTITVTGVNDSATFGGDDAGEVTEDGALTAGGTLTTSDVDDGETGFQAVLAGALVGSYGTFTFDETTGDWTYTLDNDDPDLDDLDGGETDTETLTVTALDGTTHDIIVTINGADEGPGAPTLPTAFTGSDPDPNDFDSATGGVLFTTVTNSQLNNANVLFGTSGNDVIDAKGNNDTVYGGGGGDDIDGGNDNDNLYGGTGGDAVDGGQGIDIIYGGSGNDTIDGGQGTDTIFGGSGTDTIVGSEDADTIVGGFGADTLTGNQGNDIFKYLDVRDTNDVIIDFVHGQDRLDLTAFGFDAPVNATSFGVGQNLIFYFDGANTIVLGDTDGDLTDAEFMVTLNGPVPLDATDFLV